MKARNIFALLGLSVAMGVGAFAFATTTKVKETKAADTTVYCKMTYDWWKADGAAIGAYYWKASDDNDHNTWPGTRMTPVETDTDVWKFVIPDGYDKVIFTRINGSGDVSYWDAKTGDLDVPTDDKILYTITSESGVWSGPVAGSWGTYEEPVPEEKSWMVRFDLCLASASDWDDINSIRLHYWGDGIGSADAYAPHMFYNVHEFYGVNVSLTDSQKIEGACWVINRESEGDKWSVDITKFGASDITFLDKNTDAWVIQYQVGDGAWIDGKWPLSNENGVKSTIFDLSVGVDDPVSYHFTKNPVNNTFDLKNMTFSSQEAVSFDVSGGINFDGVEYMFDEASLPNYTTSGNPNWWWMGEGTFDFFLTSGSVEIRKHVSPVVESYIYYVLEPSNLSTNDKIYSWGGSEQFGPWSGTKVDSVAGVETYFSNEVLKFQGTAKSIYKIPVDIGYPDGDTNFKWNNGEGTWESDTGTLVAGAAYWYTALANVNAGKAIDFLIAAEAKRNAAGSYSVCNISKSDAAALVNTYNALTEDQREYVDSSTVYTWTDSSKSASDDISYRNVVIQLGKIAEIEVAGSPRTIVGTNGGATIDSTTLIAVISIIALVSISSIVVLVVIKKRKHN